jgi:predicted DsbA family dithiol-disulfide isomerase
MGNGATDAGAGALVVYGDYTCALCYLLEAMLAALEQAGVSAERRGVELRPAPQPLPVPGDEEMLGRWRDAVEPPARRLGVEMRRPGVWPRTRKAHELAAFAREHNRFREVHAALYRAFFVQGRDIGRIDVLIEIAVEVGLDAASAHIALGVDRHAEDVVRDAGEAREQGVDRLPTILRGGTRLVGLPSPERLEAFVRGDTTRGVDRDAHDMIGTVERGRGRRQP